MLMAAPHVFAECDLRSKGVASIAGGIVADKSF